MLKKQVLMKKLQAVRAGAGSDITSSYEPDKKLTEGDDKPVEKTPEGMGDITFDAGGAIPTTIKAIGDPRELETAMRLKKTQLRASGLNMSQNQKVIIFLMHVVNQADKTSNTCISRLKAGKKNQITGEPLYKKGNMKENLVTISNINVKPSAIKMKKM